ncbi:MAG TPA: ABC transporter permease [Candidatus Acidoferrum sp.]
MSLLRNVAHGVRSLFRKERVDQELNEELGAYLEMAAGEKMKDGMSRKDAHRAVRLEHGSMDVTREIVRAGRWESFVETCWQDLRFAARMLGKSPGFTATAVLTLALGIGANTSIFSLLNAVMLQSIPVRHPEQLVVLRWNVRELPEESHIGTSSYGDCLWVPGVHQSCSFSYPMYKAILGRTNVFSSVLAMADADQLDLSGNGPAGLVGGELVSGNYFDTLGVSSTLGRTLTPSDDQPGAAPVIVLSYAYWQRAFGSAPEAVGKTIRLNGTPFTIVGVIDPRFTRLTPGKSHDLWVPLSQAASLKPGGDAHGRTIETNWWLAIVGRLQPGVSMAQAQAATSLVFRNEVLHGAKPLLKEINEPQLTLLPAQKGLVGFRQFYDRPIHILTVAVGIVLLIACANIAAILLARASAREKEMAVRLALGAGRARIIRQLLTESLLLSFGGAALGIVLADWGAQALAAFISRNAYSTLFIDTRPDARVLAFTLGIALLTGILFGIAPAFRGSRINVAPALKEGGSGSDSAKVPGRRFGLGSSLIVAQVALSVVVLTGAGLLVRTLANLRKIDPGFDTHNVLLFGINPKLTGYNTDRIQTLYSELQTRLASIPGVISASYSGDTLLSAGLWTSGVHVEGQPEKTTVETDMFAVGPEFFETMRLPLLSGRTFAASDLRSTQAVVIVNQTFVRRFLEGKSPIGLHLGGTTPGGNKVEREIVGVVADAKYDELRKPFEPTAYIPLQEGQAYFALRTSAPPETLIPGVRHVVAGFDDNLPLFDMRTQTQTIDRLLFNERLVARLSSLFGALALILACVGLYGLLSYDVARRTREIGIRMALGAQRREIFRLVLSQGLILAMVGTLVGTGVAIGVTRYLGSLLYGVRATDPATFVIIAFLLIGVALLACYIPGRRATRVDPLVALRYE